MADIRLGTTLWADRNVADLARLAACAERTGFDDVWWPDHYMHRDVGATLTACALATDRIRLGTAVTSPLLRHPGALASLFASLAEIAPGRIVAGIGPGGWELPTHLGIHEPRPLTVTREAALLLADLLKGRPATAAPTTAAADTVAPATAAPTAAAHASAPTAAAHASADTAAADTVAPATAAPTAAAHASADTAAAHASADTAAAHASADTAAAHASADVVADRAAATAAAPAARFPLSGAQLDFVPPQPIPLYLAARGPRMMSLAGELADGLITHSLSLPFVEHVVERVRLGAERAAQNANANANATDTATTPAAVRQPTDCSIAVWLEIFLHDDLTHARNVLRPRCKYMVGGEFDPSMIPLYGLDPAQVTQVREAVRNNDPRAHELITDEMVDAFSICGSVQRAAARIDALRAAGVSEVILSFGPGITEDEIASVGETMLTFLNR